jgi:hypothetical protein
MKCNISKEQLIGYFYKEMAPEELKVIEKHLAQCPDCQKELEELSQTSRLLQAWPAEEPDLEFIFVEEKSRAKKFRLPGWRGMRPRHRWGSAFATMFLLAFMILTVLKFNRDMNGGNKNIALRENKTPVPVFEMSQHKLDSITFHGETLAENEFQNRIMAQNFENQRILKDIDVMANIMDAALDLKYHHFYETGGKIHGAYLDGVGAVFLLKEDADSQQQPVELTQIIEQLKSGRDLQNLSWQPGIRVNGQNLDSLEDFPGTLLEIVGDYSHTLRPLPAAESIVVAVDLDGSPGSPGARLNRFILRVQKKDLDAYNQGQIQLAEFREKVQIQKY